MEKKLQTQSFSQKMNIFALKCFWNTQKILNNLLKKGENISFVWFWVLARHWKSTRECASLYTRVHLAF